MNYLSLGYYLIVAAAFLVYYALPQKHRWIALLAASIAFYCFADFEGLPALGWMILFSFLSARKVKGSKPALAAALGISILPYWFHLGSQVIGKSLPGIFLPLGLSYLSLQIIAYLADCYSGKTEPEKNLLQYVLFISFFPQVVQGPIPRYGTLAPQLKEGHDLEADNVIRGFLRILCGLFLKFVISDRAAIPANTFYAEAGVYTGVAAWVSASAYMIQLYTDFLACVLLSQGVSLLFGIRLGENFNHPFTSQSTGEFWHRWHISLSQFLRDYVYYPLGGSRKGEIRKYLNIGAVFVASALWHGVSLTFLAWGLLSAFYQIAGALTFSFREKVYALLKISDSIKKRIRQTVTAALIVFSTILFRSYGFRNVLQHTKSLFVFHALPKEEGLLIGMSGYDWIVFLLALAIFVIIQHINQKRDLEAEFLQKKWGTRYAVYFVFIIVILLLGTYGFGYDARAFIYGDF
ncbi:MAG: MBOAT family protein [Solobacterium sp.]|nr:MBOAT family protein [Solobacterium sp.]